MPPQNVKFNSESHNFELIEAQDATCVAEFSYGFPWEPIASNKGYLLQLWSSALPESQVIQLVCRLGDEDKTVGWLCTASALTSKEHEFSDNKYFRIAAGHAVQILLEHASIQAAIATVEKPTIDLFPEKTCVFVVLAELVPPDLLSEPVKLYPQLHQYSFSPNTLNSPRNYVAGKHAVSYLSPGGVRIKKLYIQSISDAVPFSGFIDSLLSESLPTKQDPPYKFFLYYQIIELLMEEVQTHKQQGFVKALNDANGDATELYELIQTLGSETKEEARIVALFQSYTKIPSGEINGLKVECLAFLDQMHKKDGINDCGKALYKVRNMLIHNMRRIPVGAYESLMQINEYLEVVVPGMLLTFCLPAPSVPISN